MSFTKFVQYLVTGLVVCFPIYVWFAGWAHPSLTALYLTATGSLKFIVERGKVTSIVDWLMILLPIQFGVLVFFTGSHAGLYYPAAINLCLLLIFFSSIINPPSFVQLIAERIEKRSLDPIGVRYAVQLTQIWCVVFSINALIAVLLAWQRQLDWWTLYNGVIAYIIIGVLIIGERLFRHRIQTKMRRNDSGQKFQ
ncbi:hypothetical protein ACFL17_08925 [Pseudomonadota bacterium]